ncbi:MAG: hypothetical protein ABIU63_10270 [Chitinophagaceae bacterium]
MKKSKNTSTNVMIASAAIIVTGILAYLLVRKKNKNEAKVRPQSAQSMIRNVMHQSKEAIAHPAG